MGGAAYLIYGKPDLKKLEELPTKRSFMDRLLGRKGPVDLQSLNMSGGMMFVDVPTTAFNQMGRAFRTFLNEEIAEPWEATRTFLSYLESVNSEVFLRGERQPDSAEPDWYIQMTFSGCAGLAEVSAELATHWADLWYARKREEIADRYLIPFGFAPFSEQNDDLPGRVFVPAGEFGYALYIGDQGFQDRDELPGTKLFELDASVVEDLDSRRRLEDTSYLDERFREIASQKECLCQLCRPDAPSSFSR